MFAKLTTPDLVQIRTVVDGELQRRNDARWADDVFHRAEALYASGCAEVDGVANVILPPPFAPDIEQQILRLEMLVAVDDVLHRAAPDGGHSAVYGEE